MEESGHRAEAVGAGQEQPQANQPPADMSSQAASQAVRFASVNQEIEPARSLQSNTQSQASNATAEGSSDPNAEQGIRSLALALHKSHIQQTKTSNFSFEPFSLPPSRVASNDSTPYPSSREHTRSEDPSPKLSRPDSAMTSPPLSRPASHATEGANSESTLATGEKPSKEMPAVPPQPSGAQGASQAPVDTPSSTAGTSRPSTGDEASTRPTSVSHQSSSDDVQKKGAMFSLGPSESASSNSRSRGTSPAPTPQISRHGSSTPPIGYSRNSVVVPAGEKDNPYARNKRPAQTKNVADIDSRFVFGNNDAKRRSVAAAVPGSSTALPRDNSAKDLKQEHRKSAFSLLGGKDNHSPEDKDREREKSHGSMSDLKRFFGIGSHHHKKRTGSPAASARGAPDKNSGTKTPPRRHATESVPFADDHGLEQKYGKFGKILGAGAGGSVRVLKRASDGRTFAVKQFRERHNYESAREYNKKVTAEFCIGSTLHHGNIIETLDIVQEGGHWFEVMEYAPYDLFAIVMTGKMSREEISCCFLQIINGVSFLHNSGLAHRDLKLDNVVVNEFGIMKIIDFGSASVFRYPFENDIIHASGVVGSDPYLAPEVYDERRYDPQPADIWSLAIIFACMSLRRFPWKAPRISDNSYKLFIAEPYTQPEDLQKERAHSHSTPNVPSQANEDKDKKVIEPAESEGDTASQHHHHHHHHHHRDSDTPKSEGASRTNTNAQTQTQKPPETVRGPWRLLRLLPRESRTIVGHMLKIDPKKRATLTDVLADPWIAGAPVCQQFDHGKVLNVETHEHILEPGASTPAPSKK